MKWGVPILHARPTMQKIPKMGIDFGIGKL